jgi:hypothetical protein
LKRPGGGPGSFKRRNKGPLSRRFNYLKNLYTLNTSSGASSTISDSDIEMLDDGTLSQFDSSSVASVDSLASTSSTNNLIAANASAADQSNDIANLTDFYDDTSMPQTPINDIEIQSFETNPIVVEEDLKQQFNQEEQIQQFQQQQQIFQEKVIY